MTDRAKFEQMLEYLINEDKSKAEELFHELVVAKSREIYENLLDDDFQVDEASEEEDEDDEEVEEGFEMGMDEVGADPADDMMGDLEAGDDEEGGDEFGGEEGGTEPATKDDVLDIKDALADLKAEFEAMLAGEEDMGDEEEMGDEEGEEEMGDEEGEEEGNPFAKENVREYVEKVAPAKMGDNGVNTKSTLAGKNDMGGTTANIAKGGTSTTGGTQGGLLKPSTTDLKSGNVNVPGGKAGIKHLSGVSKPAGGGNGVNTNSPLNGAPGRAK
jgi:hypothetical protein